MRDVIVIGAGPAGATAAERLASLGHDVLMLEEHAVVGQPVHCTGLLGDEAFEEFSLPRSLIFARAEGVRFWGAAGQSVHLKSGGVRAAVIDRAGLDGCLAGRAIAAGADLRVGSRVETIDVERDHIAIRLGTSAVMLRARACVLACGANYRFHKKLGLGLPAAFLQSAQTEIPFPQRSDIEVRFGRVVAPGGFGWLVPFGTSAGFRARVGLMSENKARDRFAALIAQFETPDTNAGNENRLSPRLKMLPLAPVTRTFSDRVVAVGDAAGLVKPTTGGGIYYGMLSGAMAAESLDGHLRSNRLDASALASYERAWRRRLGSEIRAGIRFRSVMARLSDESIDALVDLASVNGVVPLLQKTASFNWHRAAAMALLRHTAFRRIVFPHADTT